MKFKNGEKVICVNARGNNEFVLGEIYTITRICQRGGGNNVAIKETSSTPISGWCGSRFELHSRLSILPDELFEL
ncbi:MAG: hypothetical protein KQ78_00456 [Candidatus Izimaplasma bacterium HR2]|nr:MAG: hypothetical protein KQ78_00456 [Candidatus Izimaplasma bacterium HR2]